MTAADHFLLRARPKTGEMPAIVQQDVQSRCRIYREEHKNIDVHFEARVGNSLHGPGPGIREELSLFAGDEMTCMMPGERALSLLDFVAQLTHASGGTLPAAPGGGHGE